MAETNRISTILDVTLNADKVSEELANISRQIANVKNEQKQLDAEYKAGKITLAEYTASTAAMKDELAWLQKQQKGAIATTKLLTAETDTYSDSLNGERQKLADLQKAYDAMDATARQSEGGQAFLELIQEQSEAVKELEAESGRAQRNVGNYPKAWESALPILSKVNGTLGKMGVTLQGLASGGSKAFSTLITSAKAFGKAMITPPVGIIVAILSAIMLVVQKVVAAFKKNDNAMTSLKKAFAAFEPIGNLIKKIFSAIADVIAKIVNAISGAVSWILGKLIPGYKEAAEAAQELVQAQDDLEEAEREYTVNSAKRNKQIAMLREEAQNREKHSLAERKQYLDIAAKLEAQNLKEEKEIAAEHLRILEAKAKQDSDTSDETKNKIAEARAAMYQAEENYFNGIRKLNKEKKAFEQEEKRIQQDKIKAAQDAAKARLDIERKIEDELLSLETDQTKKQIEQTKLAGKREIENLRIKLDNLKKEDLEARAALQKLIEVSEISTQKKIDDITIKSAEERAKTLNQIERAKAEQGIKDALELAQMRADATEQDYQHLQALTDKEVAALYSTWEAYELALTEAETAAADARETLAVEEYNRKMQRAENEYNARLVGIDNEYALAEIEYEQAQEKYDTLLAMDEEQKAAMYDNEEEYKAAVIASQNDIAKAAQSAIKTRLKAFGELGNAFNDMSDALTDFAGKSKEAAAVQKATALAGIITTEAQSIATGALAIAEGIESAVKIGFPQNIPAIISITAMIGGMVASVMSSISQAKQIFAEAQANDAGNFSNGGTVPGTSYTGDKLIAHVNSSEGIYTPRQANNILQEIANNPLRSGNNYEAMSEAMAAAVSAQPAPVVVLKELRDFEDKVAEYDEIAKV